MTSAIAQLHEIVAALDRRTPRPERDNEAEIARDAAALRIEALRQLATIPATADTR